MSKVRTHGGKQDASLGKTRNNLPGGGKNNARSWVGDELDKFRGSVRAF